MEHFFNCFRRNGDGVWVCVAAAEVILPQGRIQVAPGLTLTEGGTFMGVELVKLLEEREQSPH